MIFRRAELIVAVLAGHAHVAECSADCVCIFRFRCCEQGWRAIRKHLLRRFELRGLRPDFRQRTRLACFWAAALREPLTLIDGCFDDLLGSFLDRCEVRAATARQIANRFTSLTQVVVVIVPGLLHFGR